MIRDMKMRFLPLLLSSFLVMTVSCTLHHQNLVWKSHVNRRNLPRRNQEFNWQQRLEGKFSELEQGLELLSEQPFFARVNNRSSVRVGETAFLPCRVKFIQPGYMVTWLRMSDSTVLSVGSETFSSDSRLSVVHVNRPQIHAGDWTLIINQTQLGDAGRYECSVNTLPKISHSVGLEVEDLSLMVMQDSPVTEDWGQVKARIEGPRTQYVSQGSTIALHCSISHLTAPPSSLYWTRDGEIFTAKDRTGISLESEKVAKTSHSKLFISRLALSDTAKYSCVSDIAEPDTIQLVVTQAAPGYALMFHNDGCYTHPGHHQAVGLHIAIISFIFYRHQN